MAKLNINGKTLTCEALPAERLLDTLRNLGVTSIKEGCGEGECGACSILMDGELVNSCLVPTAQSEGKKIQTTEGLSDPNGTLSRLQKSFLENGGAQCGICTPGMLMAAANLIQKNKKPNDNEIRTALAGNLCRCTGYDRIIASVKAACEGAVN